MSKTKTKASDKKTAEKRTGNGDQELRDVDFVLEANGAERVYLCGDFNDWRPASLLMIGNPEADVWEKRLTLAPGRYEYKFNVDGKWIHDPLARENVPNIYGSLNSIVEVQS